jgi:GPH family glycoside/pentoside/hexuronide:cation symporter
LSGERLEGSRVLGYGLPSFGTAMILISVALYLPNYYTDELGVTAGMLGWVFLLGRVWDAVTDPLMGHLSDRTRSRWGRRRPWFLVSALPLWLVFYLIWAPGNDLTPSDPFVHLLVCYLALYTFWTVFNIPYQSLGMELTPHYHERTRLFGVRQAFYIAGTAAGMLAPQIFAEVMGSKEAGYARMGAIFGGVTLLLILLAFLRVREEGGTAARGTPPFLRGLQITFRNRAFLVLLGVYLFSVVGGSFIAPLTLYVAKYVIREEWVVKYVMLAWLVGSLASIPMWLALSRRWGKNRTWSVALVVATAAYALSYSYHEGTWVRWILLAVVVGAASGCTMTLGPAIAADVIDSDELDTGRRREGAFVGVWSFADKAAVGLAVFLGMQGLELFGYRPNVEQAPAVVEGMKFLYCLLPAIFHLAAVLVFQRFPITPEVHADIRRQLDARSQAAASVPSA